MPGLFFCPSRLQGVLPIFAVEALPQIPQIRLDNPPALPHYAIVLVTTSLFQRGGRPIFRG